VEGGKGKKGPPTFRGWQKNHFYRLLHASLIIPFNYRGYQSDSGAGEKRRRGLRKNVEGGDSDQHLSLLYGTLEVPPRKITGENEERGLQKNSDSGDLNRVPSSTAGKKVMLSRQLDHTWNAEAKGRPK